MLNLSEQLKIDNFKSFIARRHFSEVNRSPRLWILVVNSEKAQFYMKENQSIVKIGEAFPSVDVKSEITNSNSGRMPNPFGGGGRHRFEAHSDAMSHNHDVFMRELADYLDKALASRLFEHLIVIAVPKMLGLLRSHLTKHVGSCIVFELNKDLVHLDEAALYGYLQDTVWN